MNGTAKQTQYALDLKHKTLECIRITNKSLKPLYETDIEITELFKQMLEQIKETISNYDGEASILIQELLYLHGDFVHEIWLDNVLEPMLNGDVVARLKRKLK